MHIELIEVYQFTIEFYYWTVLDNWIFFIDNVNKEKFKQNYLFKLC